jgi:flagellar protein FliS
MALNKAYAAYQATSVTASKPEELTMMLYKGLVRFLTQGKKAMEEKNIEKTNENLVRAQSILAEFQATLDMNYEISNYLMLLYDYMCRRLVEANLKKDLAIVDEVLNMACQLQDTWDEVMKKAKTENAELNAHKSMNTNPQSIAK